jgi:phosphoribosylformimino-5-aminoimidazole carboxamide ribonucleotide (ProFAR) isomerase
MDKYPLALLPVVTISGSQSRLPPHGYGVSAGTGTPAQAISGWVSQGAAWIHVVDQDAIDGGPANHHHIVSSGAHLQYSGAVHDDASLQAALATGASRVVIEVTDLEWALATVASRSDRLAVGLDIRQPDVLDVAGRLQHAGASRFVVVDRAEAHHWKHDDRHLLGEFCSRTNRPVMARGGIAHLGDLHALHEFVPHGLDGIIIDDALYDGAFSYSEAVAAGADRFDMFYWGPPE